jgi:hypothetical protein
MSVDHHARGRLAQVEHHLKLLADHVGIDLSALVAINRSGPLVEWAAQLAAGIDPRTGEPIDTEAGQ